MRAMSKEHTPDLMTDWKLRVSGKMKIRTALLNRIIAYSDKYQINFQMWPDQYTIYVEKDNVDLYSFGSSDIDLTMAETLAYLDRINKINQP
jgi:hypothetical protein